MYGEVATFAAIGYLSLVTQIEPLVAPFYRAVFVGRLFQHPDPSLATLAIVDFVTHGAEIHPAVLTTGAAIQLGGHMVGPAHQLATAHALVVLHRSFNIGRVTQTHYKTEDKNGNCS